MGQERRFAPMERTAGIGAPAQRGVHIEARLVSPARPAGHHIDITVSGPGDALQGSGWVTTLSRPGSCGLTPRCLFSQHGSETGGVVRLTGVTLHSSDPRDVGAQVTTEADTSTGALCITAGSLNGVPVHLEGTGTVIAGPTNPELNSADPRRGYS